MATKNPIGNYLKGEREIDSSVYQSPEGKQPYKMSRRGFLKGAAGLAGAAIFGEGLLKQMEAWAQDNGVSVYIEPQFLISGREPYEGAFNNIDMAIPMKLSSILKQKGIKVITRPEKITDDTIIIRGTFNYIASDNENEKSSSGRFLDSIEINIQYEKDGSLLDSQIFKQDERKYPDPMLYQIVDTISKNVINLSNGNGNSK